MLFCTGDKIRTGDKKNNCTWCLDKKLDIIYNYWIYKYNVSRVCEMENSFKKDVHTTLRDVRVILQRK
jgi:hypothetical protein